MSARSPWSSSLRDRAVGRSRGSRRRSATTDASGRRSARAGWTARRDPTSGMRAQGIGRNTERFRDRLTVTMTHRAQRDSTSAARHGSRGSPRRPPATDERRHRRPSRAIIDDVRARRRRRAARPHRAVRRLPRRRPPGAAGRARRRRSQRAEPAFRAALTYAAAEIRAYHEQQVQPRRASSAPGIELEEITAPGRSRRPLRAGRAGVVPVHRADDRDPGAGRGRARDRAVRARRAPDGEVPARRRSPPPRSSASTRCTGSAVRRRSRRWPTAPRAIRRGRRGRRARQRVRRRRQA